jgi:hypothetical protein
MERVKAYTHARRAAVGLLLLSAIIAVPTLAADAHVHAQAALQVAVDGNRLLLEFSSPLDNLVGFEHAPRTDKQTAAVRGMVERLYKPALLFVPTGDARCAPASVKLESAVLDPALLAEKAAPQAAVARPPAKAGRDKGKGAPEEHAALSAEIVYRCEHPEKLSSLEVRLFDAFPQVRRVDVQVAGARKQAAASLTPRNRRVSW